MRVRILLALLGAFLLLLGCSANPAPEPSQVSTAEPAKVPDAQGEEDHVPSSEDASDIEIQLVDAAKFSSEMAALEGKVVLLDMWATW